MNMEKSNRKALIAVFAASFFVAFYSMPQSLLAFMDKSFPGIAPSTVTLIVTVPTAVSVVVSLAMGAVFSRIGKKVLLLFALILYLAGTCIVRFTGGSSFPFMIVTAVIWGVAYGIILTTTNAQAAALAAPGKSATMISINTAVGASGTMSFAFLSGILAKGGDWLHAYDMGFAVVISIGIVLFLAPPMNPAVVGNDSHTKKPRLEQRQILLMVLLLLFYNLHHMGMCTISLNYSNYIVSEFQLGDAFAAATAGTALSLGGLLGGFFLTEIVRRICKSYLPAAGMFVVALILALSAAITTNLTLCYVLIFLTGAFSTTSFSGSMAALTEIAPQKADLGVSLFSATSAMAMFLCPYVVNGLGAVLFGDAFLSRYLAGGLLCLAGGIGIILIIRSQNRQAY